MERVQAQSHTEACFIVHTKERKRKESYIVSTASLANEYGHFVVLVSVAVPNSKQTGF